MPTCSIKWCGKNSSSSNYKKDNVTFHRFPQNTDVKLLWIQATKRENWFPAKLSVICSRHFTIDCFHVMKNSRRLLEGSVPKLYLPNLIESDPSRIKIIKTESLEAPTTSSAGGAFSFKLQADEDSDDDPLQIGRCASPSGLSDIGSSDLEGALDTPTVLFLKKKLRENEEKLKEKEEQLRKKDGKIESLHKANKRLYEKNTTLKQLLAKMKRKLLIVKHKTKDLSDDKHLQQS